MQKRYCFLWVPLVWVNFFLMSEIPSSSLSEPEEVEVRLTDIWSLGMSLGGQIFHQKLANFDNALFPTPVTLEQDVEEKGIGIPVRISLRYALDRHLMQGITVGCHLDYAFVNIKVNKLAITQGSLTAFSYQGEFLAIDSLGFVPHVEARILTMIENIFAIDLPPFWEAYLYFGLRLNINLYNEFDLKVDNLDIVNLGFEFGFGVEFFIADNWSIRGGYTYSTNTSDFDVVQSGVKIFSGKLQLDSSRILVGVHYYF